MSSALRDVLLRADSLLRGGDVLAARAELEQFGSADESALASAEFHALLAQACMRSNDLVRALDAIERALALRSRWPEAHQIRAIVLRDSDRLDEALHAIERALELRPDDARALGTLGSIELRRGHPAAAEAALRRAIGLSPGNALAWRDLAETLQASGQEDAALDAWRRWSALNGDSPTTRARLGWALAQAHRWQDAEAQLASAAASEPGPAILNRLAFVRRERGDARGALRAYEQAAQAAPQSLTSRFAFELLLPQVYEDQADVEHWRLRYAQGLLNLESRILSLQSAPAEIWKLDWTNFYLGYQGRDDLELQRQYSRLTRTLVESAPREGPATDRRRRRVHAGRVRIGFASSFFRTCTVGSYFGSWLTGLDRDMFDVRVFHYGGEIDATTESIRAEVERFVHTGTDIRRIAASIRAADLDVLVYPQLGMDGRDGLLAALRLAPIQCVAWGHPETTGSDHIDYFFSCADMEPSDGTAHYCERLVLLPGLGTCYATPAVRPATRVEFGLPDGERLYVCPHSLFKIHPDNDAVFAELLATDPAARLVLCADEQEPVTKHFVARTNRSLDSHGVEPARLLIQPLRPPAEFRAMLSVCDVMIDTLHWSGGNTSLDALSAGLPIVSCPGPLMRGRQSAAMLRILGLDELVTATPTALVRKAIEVASEARESIHRRIEAERGALFDRREPLDALGAHLLQIAATSLED
jgi:CRISPR-associated protein Csy1